ncbi:MAG: hypothetical protein R3B84_02020 [Zavarzinella sp.]
MITMMKQAGESFGRFFFLPAPPTILGFMRIMTGTIFLYTLFAYSYGLQEFMGPDGWYPHDMINKMRRQEPQILPPLEEQRFRSAILLDQVPHRREAVIEFLRRLKPSTEERRRQLRFIDKTMVFINNDPKLMPEQREMYYQVGMRFPVAVARMNAKQYDLFRQALNNPVIKDDDPALKQLPIFFSNLTPQERVAYLEDAGEFLEALPPDSTKQRFVLDWFSFYPVEERRRLLFYLDGTLTNNYDLPSNLPTDPTLREDVLQYLLEWGVDPRDAYVHGRGIFPPFSTCTTPPQSGGYILVLLWWLFCSPWACLHE